jgi:hypothetical protein
VSYLDEKVKRYERYDRQGGRRWWQAIAWDEVLFFWFITMSVIAITCLFGVGLYVAVRWMVSL